MLVNASNVLNPLALYFTIFTIRLSPSPTVLDNRVSTNAAYPIIMSA
jgi:hypothetical protein